MPDGVVVSEQALRISGLTSSTVGAQARRLVEQRALRRFEPAAVEDHPQRSMGIHRLHQQPFALNDEQPLASAGFGLRLQACE